MIFYDHLVLRKITTAGFEMHCSIQYTNTLLKKFFGWSIRDDSENIEDL